MEYFWGSVKLMLLVYALAAVISFIMAWIIKMIFTGIRLQKARADARAKAAAANPSPATEKPSSAEKTVAALMPAAVLAPGAAAPETRA